MAKELPDSLKSRVSANETLKVKTRELYDDLAKQGDKATADDRVKLNNQIEAGIAEEKEINRLKWLYEGEDEAEAKSAEPRARERVNGRADSKSWGQKFVESKEFKDAVRRDDMRSDRVNVKALGGSSDTTGGALIQNERLSDVVDQVPLRPASILEMINHSETSSDVVEVPMLVSKTNGAATIAEYSGGSTGLKPESDFEFEVRQAVVKGIATWVAITRWMLQDAPRIQNITDVELPQLLRVKLEDQIISGNGVGSNFTGILSTSGIQTRVHQSGARAVGTDTIADTLRRGITDIVLEFYIPNGILLNPTDAEKVELTKDDNKQYVKVYDPTTGRIWRVPASESPVLTAGTSLVGDFLMACTIWDRMMTEIFIGEPNDFFIKNLKAVLAELRAAFMVTRPKAIEKITGLA